MRVSKTHEPSFAVARFVGWQPVSDFVHAARMSIALRFAPAWRGVTMYEAGKYMSRKRGMRAEKYPAHAVCRIHYWP